MGFKINCAYFRSYLPAVLLHKCAGRHKGWANIEYKSFVEVVSAIMSLFYYILLSHSIEGETILLRAYMNSTHGCKYALYVYPMKGLIPFVAGEWHMQNFYRGLFNS